MKVLRNICLSLLLSGTVTLCSPFLLASEKEKGTQERYKAVTVISQTSKMNPATQLDILIDRYTEEDELLEYAKLLKAKGVEPLKRTLEKVNVGRISTPGSVGTAIAIARLHQSDKGRAVRLVTARPMSRIQLRRGDGDVYPFSMIELYPDKGEGIMIGTLKPYFDETGKLSIKVAGAEPVKLINVEQVK